MTGELALDCIRNVTATKCFLGTTGLSATYGLTSATAPEPAINAMMIEHSRIHIIVADSSKLGRTSSFKYGSADEIDLLITDSRATEQQMSLLTEAGVQNIIKVDLTSAFSNKKTQLMMDS
jgi:DeoR/GlpR family transcriptional regulator of sugar metabolism